jgi:hypothetical protein
VGVEPLKVDASRGFADLLHFDHTFLFFLNPPDPSSSRMKNTTSVRTVYVDWLSRYDKKVEKSSSSETHDNVKDFESRCMFRRPRWRDAVGLT